MAVRQIWVAKNRWEVDLQPFVPLERGIAFLKIERIAKRDVVVLHRAFYARDNTADLEQVAFPWVIDNRSTASCREICEFWIVHRHQSLVAVWRFVEVRELIRTGHSADLQR